MKRFPLQAYLRRQLTPSRLRWFVFVFLITFVFFVNAFHDSYPDEFDNILGGRYILEGRLPYNGFFTHHGPVAYYLAAAIQLFSGTSFVRFRLMYSFFLLGILFLGFHLLRQRLGERVSFYPSFILLVAIGATYFWGHMLLADSLSAFLLIPVYLFILLSLFYQRMFSLTELRLVSLFAFFTLFSSLTYTYLIGIIYLFSLILFFRLEKGHRTFRSLGVALLVIVLPYLLYASYLLVRGGFSDYFQQNIVFNAKYYIYNYPRPEGSGRINPLRFAIIIAHDFYNNFTSLLINAKDFNFAFPFNSALAVSNVALLLVFLLARQYCVAAFLLLALIYTNARSNPLTSGETDYQSAVYIMVSLANLTFLLGLLYQRLNKSTETAKKVIYGFLLMLVGTYGFFTFIFLLRKFNDKVFGKYMGKAPLIYDRPQLAPIVNKLVDKDEVMWIGPFEFEELFYVQGKLPSKYHILIPGIAKFDKMRQEMLADFSRNKPKVIYFDKRFFYLGSSPEMYAQFFLDFLADNYVTIFDYRQGDSQYVSAIPITERVDLETKLYIDKDKLDEIIEIMLHQNLIKPKISQPG